MKISINIRREIDKMATVAKIQGHFAFSVFETMKNKGILAKINTTKKDIVAMYSINAPYGLIVTPDIEINLYPNETIVCIEEL